MFWSNGQLSGFGSIKRSYLDGSAITTIAESNLITPCKNSPTEMYEFFVYMYIFKYYAPYKHLYKEINKHILYSMFLPCVASIAVDWINDKIYWSDENTSRIEVAELSGSHRKTLIATNLQYARGLVAEPSTR